MAAPDFFENFLLHDGLKALRPQENPLIVPLSRQRRYRQADTPQAASIRLWGRGGLASSPPVGAAFAPASVSPHYAGKSRATPGNSAFHAKDFRLLFLVFSAVFDSIRLFRAFSVLFHPLQCRM